MNQIVHENIIQRIKIDKRLLIYFSILLGSFIFCYAQLFLILVEIWQNNSVYSHGFLVPFISLYLIWLQRHRLKHLSPRPNYLPGLFFLVAGLSMFIIGNAGGVLVFLELSLIVTIIGIVILVLGKQFLKVLWFPIIYLLFMFTVWEIVLEELHFPLQIFSATLGAKILQLIGIPVYRESIYIELPNRVLEVAKVCSGVNYLISVVAIGILLAYITLKSLLRRIMLVSIGIIIAILANGLRVALIGMLSYHNIAGNLHGPYHILQAMFISGIGFIALFIGAKVLSKRTLASPYAFVSEATPYAFNPPQPILREHRIKYPLFFTFSILLIVGGYINFYHPSPTLLKKDIRWFPYEIGKWRGVDSESNYEVFKTLEFDHDLTRTYRTITGNEIELYIGYFKSQKHGKELVDYQTAWLHHDSSKIKIKVGSDDIIEVNKLIKQEGNINRLILFWYDLNGRVVTNRYKAKAHTMWNALFKRRTNGAVIMVSIDFQGREEIQKTEHNGKIFIQSLFPVLRDFLP